MELSCLLRRLPGGSTWGPRAGARGLPRLVAAGDRLGVNALDLLPAQACCRDHGLWAPLHPPLLAQEGSGTHASLGLDSQDAFPELCSPPKRCFVSMWAAVVLQAGQAGGSALAAPPRGGRTLC